MEIYSSVGKMAGIRTGTTSAYQQLQEEYLMTGFTYKSNQILHKTAQNSPRHYPYELLLHTAKVFHLNQFEIVFLSHILNDVEPCYNNQPDLFSEDMEIPADVHELIQQIISEQVHRQVYNNQLEQYNIILKGSSLERPQEGEQRSGCSFTSQELKRIYSYLLVLGYAVKYYLNEQNVIKPYDEEIRLRHPSFFASIFNKWAKKYGNTALATTPRRINSYYLALASQLEVEDNLNHPEENCQYRNYNQIVEELIKATTEGEEYNELEKDPIDE